jgi:hypothetical protein
MTARFWEMVREHTKDDLRLLYAVAKQKRTEKLLRARNEQVTK